MSLALLRFQETVGNRHRFEIDIGTNRYYQYAIGIRPPPSVAESITASKIRCVSIA